MEAYRISRLPLALLYLYMYPQDPANRKMALNISIFLCLVITVVYSCKSTKTEKSKSEKLALLVWNEDTLHSFVFAVTEDKSFYYTIVHNDSVKVENYYHGTISPSSSFDTLFLNYYKNQKPFGLKDYLVREVSGTYLIQFFDSSSKRIFLRRQKLGHWF